MRKVPSAATAHWPSSAAPDRFSDKYSKEFQSARKTLRRLQPDVRRAATECVGGSRSELLPSEDPL